MRFSTKKENYCCFRLGMEILMERGLFQVKRERKGFSFSVMEVKQKVDLEQSPIMQKLHLIKG